MKNRNSRRSGPYPERPPLVEQQEDRISFLGCLGWSALVLVLTIATVAAESGFQL